MLGTETTRALRSEGIDSIICGCSANDARESFLKAGANTFMFKPFPCEKGSLTKEMIRILNSSIGEGLDNDPELGLCNGAAVPEEKPKKKSVAFNTSGTCTVSTSSS
jgi:hypothetical protein